MDQLQGWGGEGFKVLFFNFLGQECSTACQGTAELAGGPSCLALLPSPPSFGFPPASLTADDDDNDNEDEDGNCYTYTMLIMCQAVF